MNLFKHAFKNIKKRSSGSRDFLLKIMPQNSICAEIGVFNGEFSQRILNIVNPKELHLIDPWKLDEKLPTFSPNWKKTQRERDSMFEDVRNIFKSEIEKKQIHLHRDYSTKILKKFSDEYLDWIYIDGAHDYESAKNDLELSFLKVRRGGFITGDDYGNRGEWWENNTTKAVADFIQTKKIKLIKIKRRQYILQRDT